jgi:hypothetical protein
MGQVICRDDVAALHSTTVSKHHTMILMAQEVPVHTTYRSQAHHGHVLVHSQPRRSINMLRREPIPTYHTPLGIKASPPFLHSLTALQCTTMGRPVSLAGASALQIARMPLLLSGVPWSGHAWKW